MTNRYAIQVFENNEIFPGLVLAAKLIDNQDEVLEDFIELVHKDLLIRPASPLTIHDIVCNAYDCKLNYAKSITKDNDYLNLNKIVELLKDNTNKTLRILGEPPYFHTTTV
jgi:ribonucleotide reductase beta subunit family protein with ferritin-like domain